MAKTILYWLLCVPGMTDGVLALFVPGWLAMVWPRPWALWGRTSSECAGHPGWCRRSGKGWSLRMFRRSSKHACKQFSANALQLLTNVFFKNNITKVLVGAHLLSPRGFVKPGRPLFEGCDSLIVVHLAAKKDHAPKSSFRI